MAKSSVIKSEDRNMESKRSGTFVAPEPGQLIEVCRRQWIVGDVSVSVFDSGVGSVKQHLVNLTAIDEDSLGHEIDVVWEIEPGARRLERAGLAVPHSRALDLR